MRQIPANLPALGAFVVNLHSEADSVADYFGTKEFERLGRVDHLGVASSAFPGINHTRLEYVLLQCAITQLIAKLHKDNRDLALANRVALDGMNTRISSGEELLKCWFLLSNMGHAQWTFGTERAFLDSALADPDLATWLLSGAVEDDLRSWASKVLQGYRDQDVRYLLLLLRLKETRPHDPRKYKFRQILRNLILPLGALDFRDRDSEQKLSRLRRLFDHIRLLTMVTLDAYYSHSPIRLQLLPAIQELATDTIDGGGFDRFNVVLEATAGWVADEVYLHPRAVAVQRSYELQSSRKLSERFNRIKRDPRRRRQLLNSILHDGFGRPQPSAMVPLLRLSFQRGYADRFLFAGGNRHDRIRRLQQSIGVPPATVLSLDVNGFHRMTHFDLLYSPDSTTHRHIGETYARAIGWLLDSLEAATLTTVRRLLPEGRRDPDAVEEIRIRRFEATLRHQEHLFLRVLQSLAQHLLPEGWRTGLEDFEDTRLGALTAWRVIDSMGYRYSNVQARLLELETTHRTKGNHARAHELATLFRVLKNRWPQLLIVCLKPIVVRDQFGRQKDEWDGCALEVDDTYVRFLIIEAKRGQRGDQAFQQLAQSRRYLKSRYPIHTRRMRIGRAGAYLRADLWAPR